jgi:hypothetical protein
MQQLQQTHTYIYVGNVCSSVDMALIWYNAIATKDAMAERGWTQHIKCQFCVIKMKQIIVRIFLYRLHHFLVKIYM